MRIIKPIALVPLIGLLLLLGCSTFAQEASTTTNVPMPTTAGAPSNASAAGQATAVPNSTVQFKLTPHDQDARLTYTVAGEQAIIDIYSVGGIGSADVAIVSQPLPKAIYLQFHLKGLENLRFSYGKTTVQVSLSSTGQQQATESVTVQASSTLNQAITTDSPYWMNVRVVPNGTAPARIPLQDGYISVQAPADFFAGQNRQFAIQWVDFYR